MNERPEIPDNITHTEYFDRLLKDRVNLSSIPKIPDLNATIQFKITDNGNGQWFVIVENGFVKDVIREMHEKPTCTFILKSATFISILRKEITPQKAFFEGHVEIQGNLFFALKMNILVGYL
jgi:putative sterol carrier protein